MNVADLKELGITSDDILEGVIERAAREYSLPGDIQARVQRRAYAIIDERVGAVVDELLTREFQQLDVFGDKRGEPTTIKEMLAESLQTWWSSPVDEEGRAVNRSAYGTKTTRADYLLSKIARDVIDNSLSAELRAFAGETKREIRAAMSKTISEIIAKKL